MTELVELWRFREVTLNLVRRNLKVRYKNSLLGFAWSLLNPLMQIGVWWLVFGVIMPPKGSMQNYMPFLLAGFLPWLFFSQTVLDSAACVTQEMALVKKAYFPRTILPLSSLISNLVHLALAVAVMLTVFTLAGWASYSSFWTHLWLLLPASLLIIVFTYGVSAMVAAWSVFYADVKFIVGNLLGLWFFLTPVLYPIALVLEKTSVEGRANWLRTLVGGGLQVIQRIYLADPLSVGVLGYRSALLHGGSNPLVVTADYSRAKTLAEIHAADAEALARQVHLQGLFPFSRYVLIAAGIAILTAVVGQIVFRKLAPSFAERG